MKYARALPALLALPLAGCGLERLVGGMAQNFEYSKLVEVHPQYTGLQDATVAVVVETDMATRYEHPDLELTIAAAVGARIQRYVQGARVLSPAVVADWQFRTPSWNALPYNVIAERLGVDRVVHIDVYEYRLHPPGNRWLWEGVCAARVGIIEREGIDPDAFVDVFDVYVSYPPFELGRDGADAARIQTALLALFARDAGFLFYKHLEPKYPDKYRGEVPEEAIS